MSKECCMLSKRSCLALKSPRSICFSSSILRVWVFFCSLSLFTFVCFDSSPLVRCIIISIIFPEKLYSRLLLTKFFFLSVDSSFSPSLLCYCSPIFGVGYFSRGSVFLYSFRPFQFFFLFLSLASGVFRFIYLFMVKMHLIYDCDGYSSFTGTNSFRIHIFWYAVCCVVVVVVFGGRVYFSVRVHFFLSFGCVYSLLSLLPVSCSFSGWLSNGGVAFLAFGH